MTYNGVGTNKLLNTLLKEGFKVDMFIKVMESKQNEWEGTKWDTYLRPQTLFAKNNFIRYASDIESGVSNKKVSGKDMFEKSNKTQAQIQAERLEKAMRGFS